MGIFPNSGNLSGVQNEVLMWLEFYKMASNVQLRFFVLLQSEAGPTLWQSTVMPSFGTSME